LIDICWEYAFAPDHTQAPYHLALTVTKPLKACTWVSQKHQCAAPPHCCLSPTFRSKSPVVDT
jgi:hypothetical protein